MNFPLKEAVAVVVLCSVRIIGNELLDQTGIPACYFISQAIFETGLLSIFYRHTEGWVSRFVIFCAFASGFVLIREIVSLFADFLGNPTKVSLPDRILFWAGIAGLIFHEWRLWKKSKG